MKKLSFTVLSLLTLARSVWADDGTDYGDWKPVNGWPGLQFHVKRNSSLPSDQSFTWWVQFENTYNQKISFNFNITPPNLPAPTLTDGMMLGAGRESADWFIVGSHDSVQVWVGQVTLGDGTTGNAENSQSSSSGQQFTIQQQQTQLQQQIQAQQAAAQQQQAALQQEITEKQQQLQTQREELNTRQQRAITAYNAAQQNYLNIQNTIQNGENQIIGVIQQQEAEKEAREAKDEMDQEQAEADREQRDLQAQIDELQREASLTPEQRAEEQREQEEQQRQQQLQQQRQAEQQRQEALRQQQQAERERQQIIAAIPNFAGTWRLDLSATNGQLKLWLNDSRTLEGNGKLKFKRDDSGTDSRGVNSTDIHEYTCEIDGIYMETNEAASIVDGCVAVSFSGNCQDRHYHRDHYWQGSDTAPDSHVALPAKMFLFPILVPVNLFKIHRTSSTFEGQLIFTLSGELYLGKDGQRIVELEKVN